MIINAARNSTAETNPNLLQAKDMPREKSQTVTAGGHLELFKRNVRAF
jgi:hypothetical protein